MAVTTDEQTYSYVRPSELTFSGGRADLLLATSGGRTAAGPATHPVFFDGFLGHAEQAAAALLAVAKVARTRFYVPPGMVAAILRAADPVVTSNGDRLRFESFSACCGVYARYDALPGSLDGTLLDTGTTNVDFNPPMRDALARIGGLEPLHLQVGEDVVVRTLDAEVTEKKVPLPERWLKGFAEVQIACATVSPAFDVAASEARRFIRGLPSSGSRKPVWVVPAGRGLRITTRPTPDAVSLSGLDRLKPLEPLLRFARSLRAYAAPHDAQGATGVWELELDDARFVLVLSPESSRGFSGEGGVLWDLADEQSAEDADLISALLTFEPRIDISGLSAEAGLAEDRVTRALSRLGAAGRVGYDVAEGGYFHRELPYDADRLATMHPRLRDAITLVETSAVRLDGETAYVRSGDTEHVVRRVVDGDRCTCPWYAKHKGNRGPCKHVLAVDLVRKRER
ncbi:SWIM zinc finger family protein [Nocardioides jejuensis]|uniref:SWIM zinc finger family protein n=1 Tax=Nocardioides jejuensis TaxID=2502782 RepID=A0A4R1CLG8_9ACTN|nr:SWIM zinc finger family protein [Nocardioides jejuensis]TCJ31066.1 SWIM zinc finger family protein [Nocardioides jejuensis]